MSYGTKQASKDYDALMKEAAEQQMRGMLNAYQPNSASLGQANMRTPLSPVASEMQALTEIVDMLHKRLSTLEERLRPVLVSGPECPTADAMPATASTGVPLADQIRMTGEMAVQLRDRMEGIISRVAV
jgi:hypothetical protein